MQQAFATVAIPFEATRAAAVNAVLAQMGHPADRRVGALLDATERIHFMSMSVVPPVESGPAHLILEFTADGGTGEALDLVAEKLRDWLVRIFAAAGIGVAPPFADFLRWNSLTLGQGLPAALEWRGWAVGLPFSGAPDMSVRRIRRERDLAAHIGDQMAPILAGAMAPLDKLQAVRARLWSQEAQKWAFVPEPAPFLEPAPAATMASRIAILAQTAPVAFLWLVWPILAATLGLLWVIMGWMPALALPRAAWLAIVGCILDGLAAATFATAVLAIALAVAAILYLLRLETTDPTDDRTPDAAQVAAFLAQEAAQAQNLLPSASRLKGGWFRRVTLRFALRLIAWHGQRADRPGFLGTMGVIHFARWMVLPRTDTLLFWSNYDGSWEGYVETFIQQSSHGVNAIWSNTRGFPRTRFLLLRGSQDGDRLRRWARRQQYPVPFWYSAYPDVTLERIRLNAAIRQGIATISTCAAAADWLACFGSAPRPASVVERDEIPTLAFGGRRHLAHCACLILEMSPDQDACRAWLRVIAPDITFGHDRSHPAALALAFGVGGLRKLGLDEQDLKTFSPAFQNGMASEGRARALGDTGESAPETWRWGTSGRPADAILIVYAESEANLNARLACHCRFALTAGHRVTHALHAKTLPDRGLPKEPFGFLDGISNPIPAGLRHAGRPAAAGQDVATGEFVLGYQDNSGYLPPTPQVASVRDPHHLLRDVLIDPQRQRPCFEADGAALQRDFGRNGTYLVVRQIEQDVKLFKDSVDEAAQRCGLSADHIAAKIVGRWRNGESLIRRPDAPSPGPPPPYPGDRHADADNDFLFGRDDPEGLRCPLGAHIRRANPRDNFDADTPDQLTVTNRHRILRVGRIYTPPQNEKPGLIFMCLNADIERQFEFVQQNWLLGRSFHGLENECDPTVAPADRSGRFTIPTRNGPLQLAGLPAFTTIRGGGYFFMPGRRAVDYLGRIGRAPGLE